MQLKSKQAWVFRKTALELLLGVFSTHLHAENVRPPALRSDTESNKQTNPSRIWSHTTAFASPYRNVNVDTKNNVRRVLNTKAVSYGTVFFSTSFLWWSGNSSDDGLGHRGRLSKAEAEATSPRYVTFTWRRVAVHCCATSASCAIDYDLLRCFVAFLCHIVLKIMCWFNRCGRVFRIQPRRRVLTLQNASHARTVSTTLKMAPAGCRNRGGCRLTPFLPIGC